jgi:hypothetical protein
MQLQLNLNTKTWQIRTPQCGSPDGWSEWAPLDRLQALNFIEMGWTYEVIA